MPDYPETERQLLLACSFLRFLTSARVNRLYERYGSLTDAIRQPAGGLAAELQIAEEQARLLQHPLALPAITRAIEEARPFPVVTRIDPEYPPLLLTLHDPPPLLWYRGSLEVAQGCCIAIVGSRIASPYGENVSRRLARELSAAGAVVVSGFARGIDAAAHEETITSGGRTIAVLGTGIDVAYPRNHRRLADAIAAQGLLLTEFPPGTPPLAANFPVRNRIISGLSIGVVVVEATEKSGSLITARLAAEQGREVFAVPGPLFSNRSAGPHRLIQDGAKLVHDIADIAAELPELRLRPAVSEEVPLEAEEVRVMEQLSLDEGRHIDWLTSATGLPPGRLATLLLQLELKLVVRSLPGSRFIRAG
jgi:DNA processing protein